MAFSEIFCEYVKKFLDFKCNIYTEEKSVNEYGESVFSKILKYSDIPCRINWDGEELFSDNGVYKNEYTVSFILPSDVFTEKGDIIEVFYNNEKRMFYASGEMVSYITHNEIKAVRREEVFW